MTGQTFDNWAGHVANVELEAGCLRDVLVDRDEEYWIVLGRDGADEFERRGGRRRRGRRCC